MERIKYQGNYRIGYTPNTSRMKKHNALSWEKVDAAISKAGGFTNFDALTIAVKDHESGSKGAPHPHQFVIYCIRNNWLEST
jgi:hypothetical protein